MVLPPSKQKCRSTTVISRASARNFHHASRFALPHGGYQSRNGCPKANVNAPVALNLSVNIQWNLTETGIDNFAALRNQRFCRWLRTRCKQLNIDVAPYYIYSREKNHTHWQVHVPTELIEEFVDLVPRWITSLESKGNGPRRRAENHDPAPKGTVQIGPVRNSVALRKYMLKGINPRDAFRYGIKKPECQGVVYGRRTGVSRTLGRAARKKAGYRAQWPVWKRGNGRVILQAVAKNSLAKVQSGVRLEALLG